MGGLQARRFRTKSLHETLVTTATSRGATAAFDQYREFRNEYLGSGLYDFREPTLNIVATRLLQAKKPDDAIPILMFNAELFPKSAGAQVALGLPAMEKGDLAAAETAFKKALEIEPTNRGVTQSLEEIRKKRGNQPR